jgi:hypothetical protein
LFSIAAWLPLNVGHLKIKQRLCFFVAGFSGFVDLAMKKQGMGADRINGFSGLLSAHGG